MASLYFVERKDGSSLCHYGILGQKWGVRRFQNKDGTLTAEGRRRLKSDRTEDSSSSDHKVSGRKLNAKEFARQLRRDKGQSKTKEQLADTANEFAKIVLEENRQLRNKYADVIRKDTELYLDGIKRSKEAKSDEEADRIWDEVYTKRQENSAPYRKASLDLLESQSDRYVTMILKALNVEDNEETRRLVIHSRLIA